MAQRKATMNKIRELLRLKDECGLSLRKISRAMKLSRPVITDHLQRCKIRGITHQTALTMPDDELEALLRSDTATTNEDGRYLALSARFEHWSRELTRVGVTRQLLWEEYRNECSDGYGYSQFCHHLQFWKTSHELSMHMEHKAGDKMFVDYAGEKLSIVDRATGEIIPVEVFVAILGASQLTYVEATLHQKKQDFINACVNALHFFGGVPRAIVPDNLKAAVTKAHRYEPDINPEYIDFARHYDTTILPARPYKPRDKALVEGAVRIVYQQVYARLRDQVFHFIGDLNAALREELVQLNNRTMKGYGKSRRELFDEIEKAALLPLPIERHEVREFMRVKAQFNYHVYLKADRHYYSVPCQYRGLMMDVFYGVNTVEIYHRNVRIAIYRRDRAPYRYTTAPEHMPPNHRFLSDWSAEKFISWSEDIGADVRTVIENVLSLRQHPEQSYKTCLGILNYAKRYGKERLARACARAIQLESYSCKIIGNILENNMDRDLDPCGLLDSTLPLHENIRGSDYYSTEEQ
jgi:transposase